jgi:hypothetical protein
MSLIRKRASSPGAVAELEPEAVIAIHSESEPDFIAIAQGYPVGFVADP